jgi:hypothetical protein
LKAKNIFSVGIVKKKNLGYLKDGIYVLLYILRYIFSLISKVLRGAHALPESGGWWQLAGSVVSAGSAAGRINCGRGGSTAGAR